METKKENYPKRQYGRFGERDRVIFFIAITLQVNIFFYKLIKSYSLIWWLMNVYNSNIYSLLYADDKYLQVIYCITIKLLKDKEKHFSKPCY